MSDILLLGAWDGSDLWVFDYEEVVNDGTPEAQAEIDILVKENARGHELPWSRTFPTHKLEEAMKLAYEIEVKDTHGLLYDQIDGDVHGDAG